MANDTKVTMSGKMLELMESIPTILKTGDVDKITNLRDGIIVLRALLGSGGLVELTPRPKLDKEGKHMTDDDGNKLYIDKPKEKVSDSGVTQTFDDLLTAMADNGMIDKDKVPTIIKRDKTGRPAKEIKTVSASILL